MMLLTCPKCKCDLGEPTDVDLNTVGWCCTKCNIKIYMEKEK